MDLDMVSYIEDTNVFYNELEAFYPVFMEQIIKNYNIKTTWFLRIDSQMEQIFGSADFSFQENKELLKELIKNGGELGWHHHAYKKNISDKWVQESDESKVLSDIYQYGPLARQYNLTICRMGWGFQTNATLKALSDLHFLIDSSAIPRPKYTWDISQMDWEGGTTVPYHPSVDNYKLQGDYNLSILEVPITTSLLKADYDESEVIRYLNPAYHHSKFIEAFNSTDQKELICMIMHPYEVMPAKQTHNLLSFSIEDLKKNINFLKEKKYEFISFKDLMIN